MNAFTRPRPSARTTSHAGEVKRRSTSAPERLWRAMNLRPLITFTTGVLTGLLIPSANWPAIVVVIVAGVLLRRIARTIDAKCANIQAWF